MWSMVFGAHAGRLQPGETVLVHGGTSGIGTMAIQLAHGRGARVFATAGTPRKVRFCRELGADVAINYHDEEFEDADRERHGRRRASTSSWTTWARATCRRNVASLAVGGRLIVLGMQGGTKGELNLGTLLAKRATVHAAGLRGRPGRRKAEIVAETQATSGR